MVRVTGIKTFNSYTLFQELLDRGFIHIMEHVSPGNGEYTDIQRKDAAGVLISGHRLQDANLILVKKP
jgi:hypothetical protein